MFKGVIAQRTLRKRNEDAIKQIPVNKKSTADKDKGLKVFRMI